MVQETPLWLAMTVSSSGKIKTTRDCDKMWLSYGSCGNEKKTKVKGNECSKKKLTGNKGDTSQKRRTED